MGVANDEVEEKKGNVMEVLYVVLRSLISDFNLRKGKLSEMKSMESLVEKNNTWIQKSERPLT